jgi:hypothetical protein
MAINEQYAREVHGEFGYFATWLPTLKTNLGDVGIIRDGIFETIGTLQDFDITAPLPVDHHVGEVEFTSAGGVSVEFKGGGEAAPTGSATSGMATASFLISFSRADAILFQASGCKNSTLSNIKEVADQILSRYREGIWPPDHVFMTEVVSCEAATILISSGANAHISLTARGELSQGRVKLANANAELSVNSYSAIGTSIIGARGLTPLFRAAGIKKAFFPWRDASIVTKRDDPDLQVLPLTFVDFYPPPIRTG